MTLRQFKEIHALQKHVAEFCVRNALIRPFQAIANGIPLNHGINGEMFANVPQERYDIHALSPVQVIHNRGGRRTFKIKERAHLSA